MRLLRLLAAFAVIAGMMCACGGHAQTSHTQRPCRFTADSVSARLSPLIQVQPQGSGTTRTITAAARMPCHTVLSVAQSGAADSKFGRQARCQLRQDRASRRSARLISRDPVTAFFRLAVGRVVCTFKTSPRRIGLCGLGTLLVTGIAQAATACDRDPLVQVAVCAGKVRVIDPAGTSFVLLAGQELTFDFRARRSTVTAAQFSADDIAVFATQAKAMQLTIKGKGHGGGNSGGPTPTAQTISFTSQVPGNARPGDTYAPAADGGASGNPVIFTIASASAGVCSIDASNTVTFTAAGTCTIDANQAGNAQYRAARQARQSVLVGQSLKSQMIMFTSSQTTALFPGDSYQVTAVGGRSGNPVTFTIDSKSTSDCWIDVRNTVTFKTPGTCTIDAEQAGNAQYSPAHLVQQSVVVSAVPA